jgi:hypothetical protein
VNIVIYRIGLSPTNPVTIRVKESRRTTFKIEKFSKNNLAKKLDFKMYFLNANIAFEILLKRGVEDNS